MTQERDVGYEQLEMMPTPVLHASVCVTDVSGVYHISGVTSDRVWVSDYSNLILTDTTGDNIHCVTDILQWFGGLHTVNSSGELIYIDSDYNLKILSTDNKTVTTLLESPTSQWQPVSVHCSPSTGDLIVGICYKGIGKITRYNSTGQQHIVTIEHDNTGHTLYSVPNYITENTNGDIIVSDLFRGAVVVTESEGRHRFSYTGPPSGSSLDPRGICTDALSHILVCDIYTNTVQMIDKDGHFLSLLLTRQQHGTYTPRGLNYDDKTHLLWVGSELTRTISVYRYIQRKYSLTDDSVGDDEISKSTDAQEIRKDTSKRPTPKSFVRSSCSGIEKGDTDLIITLPKPVIQGDSFGDDVKIYESDDDDDENILEDVSGISMSPLYVPLSAREKTSKTKTIPNDVVLQQFYSQQRANMYSMHSVTSDFQIHMPSREVIIRNLSSACGILRSVERLVPEPSAFKLRLPAQDSGEALVMDISGHGEKLPWKSTSQHWITKEHFAMRKKFMREKFNETVEHLRETGEATIRIKSLVNYLGIEENPHLLTSQTINNDYEKIITHLDHLDCVVIDFGTTTKPFIQSIKPFHGNGVNDFLEWTKDSKTVFTKTRSTQWGSISSVLFAIYAKEAILEFKPKELAIIIDYILRCAMKIDNFLLAFEIVKTYLFDNVIQLQRIFQDNKEVSPVIIRTVLQTSRKMILRKFPNLQRNDIVLSFCWDFGKENRLVMIMSYKGSIDINNRIPKEVMGLTLVLYNFTQLSDEASSVFKTAPVPTKTPLPTISEGEARKLFRKHSNLTMISASPYKSMGYSKGKQTVVQQPCISLFCFHKGYIPYGEEKFPKHLGKFEVDVQEGYCVLGSGASLEIGGYICRSGCGSIGGFVDLPNNKTGLITCAHVIFSSKELEKLESINGVPPGIEVKAFDRTAHTYRVCGTCTAAEFPKCFQQATSTRPNVDAALIELDPAIKMFRLRTVSSDQLYSAGFDPDNPPVFSGEVVPLSDPDTLFKTSGRIPDKLEGVVKYGVTTGLTVGDLYHRGAHVRFIDHDVELPDKSRSVLMCDQIEIQNFPQGQFFECGDSGSFVFCINPDKTLSCLGMAVGFTLPQKSCLVTPIDRVLHSVCPGAQLKPCSSFTPTLDRILAAIGRFQTSLDNVETNVRNDFQSSLQRVQTSIQNVERNVERNFQSSLQSTETNFRASLQDVQRNVERNFQTLQNLQTDVQSLQSQIQQTEHSKTHSASNQSSANNN